MPIKKQTEWTPEMLAKVQKLPEANAEVMKEVQRQWGLPSEETQEAFKAAEARKKLQEIVVEARLKNESLSLALKELKKRKGWK
jgi:plasmid maintenance system antidote protein VapI